jgi:5-methylcytosine-specific restriction endonuclease McrA
MGTIRTEAGISQLRLTIELVPEGSWYDNVRSHVSQLVWDLLRKHTYKRAKHHCEICSQTGYKQGFNWPVECHEIWEYDDKNNIQKLTGLIALCPHCHKVKHAGRTITVENNMGLVIRKLSEVNNMTLEEADLYVFNSLLKWSARSRFKWQVDVSILDQLISNADPNALKLGTHEHTNTNPGKAFPA